MNLFKKKTNDASIIREMAIAQQFADGTVQGVYFIDSKDDYTESEMAKCRPLTKISQGSIIFDAKLNVGVFQTDKSVEWGD